ncbi:protein FAM26E-like [Stylophora pistillata]|uniref:protein FAM26E-like n=1 Tax=Stylophora pistillata TaxID=50429 RepID=UPI000C047C7E|nr:protein FAM26E-like [Stylophora pistillata]
MSGTAATVLVGITNVFKEAVRSNEVSIKATVAGLLLYGVKEFLNDIIFSCPDEHFLIYGSLFIFGPSIFLFCLSLLASSPFWQAVTGCCLLTCRRKKLLFIKAKNSVFVACLPPLIWLIYAFVEEDYYVCAKLGPLIATLAKANTTVQKEAVNKEFVQAKTTSQLIAWGLVLGIVILSTIFVTIYRLCMPIDPKLLDKYALEEYEADEAVALFNDKVKPYAEQQAQDLINGLFEKYKDKDREEQLSIIEEQLGKLFPRHAGVLAGSVRSYPSGSRQVSPKNTEGGNVMELRPMVA